MPLDSGSGDSPLSRLSPILCWAVEGGGWAVIPFSQKLPPVSKPNGGRVAITCEPASHPLAPRETAVERPKSEGLGESTEHTLGPFGWG